MKASSKKTVRFFLGFLGTCMICVLAVLCFFTLWNKDNSQETQKAPSSPDQADLSLPPEENQDQATLPKEKEKEAANTPSVSNKPEKETDEEVQTDPAEQVSPEGSSAQDTAAKQPDEQAPSKETPEAFLASMSLEEKVAQLFFITPEALTGFQTVTAAGETTKAALDRYPVGGLVYFAQNLVSPAQTKEMLSTVQEYMNDKQGFPIFLGVDEEGGRVLRIGSQKAFSVERVEAMGELAKQGDRQVIREAGNTIGAYLSDLGFNVDFAPDADVITNSENQVIGTRSFGTDPQTVADMAWAFCEGLHENQILASYKHFPGHGGTTEDSHSGYAFSYKTLEELREMELVPFQSGCEKGVDFIMVAHISLPNVTGSELPASLSNVLITDLLREEMGYQGIIITDALGMGAIAKHYNSAESALLALEAGCDMLLMPGNFSEAYSAVIQAVKDGRLTEERIEESVRRILLAKLR